ncbi:MAG TPA: precorrin-3B C(17)-methyltransferase [Actinophytocola sp.]|uniref:precorrin-3B C(17)-methyltransferase n=1 Tax=Actinophytocola sp. TaxID=1872138 RepID=UPI002DBFBD48|nr:precorrin-3B C(17)-methyltransferase [Actinophytocola sp.]HEU5470558.1 precorrin-3B C(17)-methyltransferase [Actinophytocola sp.]
MSTGTLYGVGLGPGDPELVTVKAARLIGAAGVIAYHSARHGRSIARGVAAPYLSGTAIEEPLVYPLTVETTDHPGGYAGAIADFYADAAARLAVHLDAGRDVVLLCEGDPLFYGSYLHMHKRLADRYRTEVVPGVTSLSAAAAVTGRPLVEGEEILTVLPGTLPAEVLTERLAGAGPAAVLKLGRTFEKVRKALTDAGRLDEAIYVERATWPTGRVAALSEVDPDSVPYFSLALLPSSAGPVRQPESPAPSGTGEVVVVGLGPGGRGWLTPEAQEAIAGADDLVGYQPYLDRVPPNPRQRRHPSDNRVEAERAAHALALAAAGARVAVVSSGDPGVFAMASAVFEAAAEPRFGAIPVRVVPGVSAAQAVAARVGAPLGHDFCTVSLSDRLKPWEVIAERLSAAAAADFVIAIYNPASRSRRHQLVAAKELLLAHRSPDTPVVLGRDVGGAAESVTVLPLGSLDPSTVDMRCLLIVGSSRTRVVERADGSRSVFTPRHYPAS